MKALLLEKVGKPLRYTTLPVPSPSPEQILIKVLACGICRTDLHIVDGELKKPKLPLIMGHQIVGEVASVGKKVERFSVGDKVGVAWLGYSCGQCGYCINHQENLCDKAKFTGYDLDGGLAEYTVAEAKFAYPLSFAAKDSDIAPLLCAGLIGYRAYKKAAPTKNIGFYGFGSSAHILSQLARYEKKELFAFTREGDNEGQAFAKKMGAAWTGSSKEAPPHPMESAIIFASVGELVPEALSHMKKGGRVVCAGIHMSDIPSFPYKDLWGERSIESVANLTRKDAEEFLPLATKIPIKTQVTTFALSEVDKAIDMLHKGKIKGSAVVDMTME